MSANVGGYIRGPWWRYNTDDEKSRRCFVVAWGNIVKEPSEKYESLSITRFIIKTGRGAARNERHLACCAYGDRMARVIANACEKGDVVFLCGTWIENTRKNKKGATVVVYETHVNILIPMGLIGFLLDLFSVSVNTEIGLARFIYGLYLDPKMRGIAMKNIREYEEADIWESDYDD